MPNNNAIESMDEEDDTFNCGMTCDELKEFVFAHLDTADYTVRLKKDLHELNVRLDQVTDKAKETDDLFSSCYALLQKRKEGCGATTNCSVKSAEIVLSDEEDDLVIVDDPESNMQQTKLRRSASADRVGSLLHEQSASHASLQQQIPKRSLTVLNLQKQKPIDLAIGMKLYAKKSNYVWYKGTLVDIVNPQRPISERLYKVKFDGKGLRTLGPKLIASTEPPSEPVPVGTRILALYNDDNNSGSFYAGIVAESPSIRNNNRYLVFFDDGYAQYSFANHIRKVYEQSQQVWEDVDPDSQEFIHSYLKQYPERPMVRLNVGQVVKTEWKGQWYPAHVRKVDASLVQMYFEADRRVEWIYRGSTRLEPLFTELANAEAVKLSSGGKGRRRCTMVAKTNHSRPVVEYTRNVDDTSDSGDVKKQSTARKTTTITTAPCSKPQTSDLLQAQAAALVERIDLTSDEGGDAQRYRENGAIGLRSKSQRSLSSSDFKKSSGAKLNATACTNRESDGTIIILDYPDMSMWPDRPKQFVKHTCGPQCLFGDDNPANYKGHNPLFIPIDCGWQRQTARHSKSVARKSVFYVAPCKRRFRNESEVDKFLVITNSRLTIDMFCFEPDIRVDTEFVSTRTFCDIKDLSYCKESVPISCVNGMTHEYPDFVEYSNQRIPANGVNLNLDPEFLCGCDCTDGCRDPTRCQCIQLTLEQSKAWPSSLLPPTLHYVNRRLIENISTGIFECNSRCKCDSRCHNRVVQNGLSLKLQVFKTEKRGWGLRCLHDIPAGCFICIYAGQLLNDEGANEDGKQFGDEYLAELDLIEVVEHTKEDYESDVEEPDSLVTSKTHRRSTIDYSEHSSDNEGKHEDSDSTYSGERRSNKQLKANVMHQKGNKKTGNNVKSCGQTSRKSTKNDGKKARTAAWVNDSASVSITISDDEDSVPTGCAVDTTDLRTVGEPSCAIESSAATDHIIEAVNTTGLSSACGNATTDASFLAITDATDVIASRSEHDPNDKVDAATSTIAPPSENDIKIEATAVTSMTKDEPVASKTDEDTTTNESITTMLDEEKGTSSVATEVSAERTETDKMHLHVAFGEIAGDKVDDGVDSSIVTCERKAESTNFGDVVTNSVCHGHVFIENISCSDVPTAVDDRVIETVDSIATVGLIDTVKIEDIVDQCAVASDPVEEGGLSSVDNKQKDIEGNHDDSGAVNGHYQQSITDSNLDQHITSGENDQHNFEADTSDSVEKSGAVDRCGKLEADHNGKETEILITELTSLNTDNIDPDSDDERPSNIEASVETLSDEQQTCKRLTRSTIPMSRFHNLPDPKSQQSINKPTSKSATGKQHQRTDSDKKEEKIGTRELFGDELCYIMDAKSVGNLGRYLNHSCDPNVFVQNVFVDTHDLRFPWVAFFSSQHITAGTELTWDYQYEVGSVKDKMLYCYCGSSNCRGRLL